MYKPASELVHETQPALKGGRGAIELIHILEQQELGSLGRLFAISVIPPGASIGWHQHCGDSEVYYFLRGTGRLNDNGTWRTVAPGDMALCPDGCSHALENTGEEPLEYVAAILNF